MAQNPSGINTLYNIYWEMFSTLGGYHKYIGGYHEYIKGYHEYIGGIS